MLPRYKEIAVKVENGVSIAQIAKDHNVKEGHVRDIFRSYGASILKKKTFYSVDELRQKLKEYREIKAEESKYTCKKGRV